MDTALELVVAGREVTVRGVGPGTTIAALSARLGAAVATVDGRPVAPSTTLVEAGVVRGSELAGPGARVDDEAGDDTASGAGAATVVWRAGPLAGRREVLAPGVHVVGRALPRPWVVTVTAGRAPEVAPADGRPRPAPFTVTSGAPASVDDRAGVDAGPPPVGPGRGPWSVTWNRPPRPAPVAAAAPLVPPEPPTPVDDAARGGTVLPLLVSAVGSAVMAVVLRQPLWLLMGGLGAVAALVGRWSQRRHERRRARRAASAADAALAAFAVAVAARHEEALRVARERPGVVAAVGRATGPTPDLWAGQPGDDDAFTVVLGEGTLAWSPALSRPPVGAAADVLPAHGSLAGVPVPVRLGPGAVVGVVGPRRATRSMARATLVQLAAHHGPADVRFAALADRRAAPWAWLGWLPHATHPHGDGPSVAAGDAAVDELVAALTAADAVTADDGDGRGPLLVAVIDGAALLGSATAAARALVLGRRRPCAVLVLAERAVALPAACTQVLEVGADGASLVWRSPATGAPLGPVAAAGVDPVVARRAARALAGVDDPEASTAAATLPAAVPLAAILGPDAFDADALARRWLALGDDPPPRAPVAVAADGIVELDLARDGPHALVAGTTGSGKSELLRTLVAALAVRSRPDDLSFVLVDYKGGAAFDACAALPHVVGVVTDLDDALAERALVSLEAEVRRRERLLRSVGASDLAGYRRLAPDRPLPRLVVVVDEFAALARELPGFLAALVDVARRGRSLGLHLVLATQRPQGAVSDDIRANTDLRVALRVQDTADAIDVVRDAAPARLPRDRPGRLVVRLGHGELLAAQAAWCTGPGTGPPSDGTDEDGRGAVEVTARVVAGWPYRSPTVAEGAAPTELERLVTAVRRAHECTGRPAPPRPWLPPLPERLTADTLTALSPAAVGLADDPARQWQGALTLPDDGALLVVGPASAGAAGVLARAVVAAAASAGVHLLDGGATGGLDALVDHPSVGSLVRVAEHERVVRLVRTLHAEVRARRDAPDRRHVPLVLAVDQLAAVRAALDEPATFAVLDALDAVLADGPGVGVRTLATVDRLAALPARVAAAFAHRWVLAGAADAASVAAPSVAGAGAGAVRVAPRGRVLVEPGGLAAQVAEPPTAAEIAAVAAPGRPAPPAPIGVLPVRLAATALAPSRAEGAVWRVPVGWGDEDLAPVVLTIHDGDQLVVAGPARSGRTSALRLLARAYRQARPAAPVLLVAGRRPPPARPDDAWRVVTPAGLAGALADVGATAPVGAPPLVLVDDADRVDDVDGALGALVAAGEVTLVAASSPDALRSLYGHWTQRVRRGRTGVLLQPTGELDGDVLSAVLPRRSAVSLPPGRGYLVRDGCAELVQLALVDDDPP